MGLYVIFVQTSQLCYDILYIMDNRLKILIEKRISEGTRLLRDWLKYIIPVAFQPVSEPKFIKSGHEEIKEREMRTLLQRPIITNVNDIENGKSIITHPANEGAAEAFSSLLEYALKNGIDIYIELTEIPDPYNSSCVIRGKLLKKDIDSETGNLVYSGVFPYSKNKTTGEPATFKISLSPDHENDSLEIPGFSKYIPDITLESESARIFQEFGESLDKTLDGFETLQTKIDTFETTLMELGEIPDKTEFKHKEATPQI